MFVVFLFSVAALLQTGRTQTLNQCVTEIRKLKDDLQTEVRDTAQVTITSTLQELIDNTPTKHDIEALNYSISVGHQRSNHTAEEVWNLINGNLATKEDIKLTVNEMLLALNESVSNKNQLLLDILVDTKVKVDEQGHCLRNDELERVLDSAGYVTRDEVRTIVREEVESIIRNEIQSLLSYFTEVQQNNTAMLLKAVGPGSEQNPTSSCKFIPQGNPSGFYWIQTNSSIPAKPLYCDMTKQCCGSIGGWMKVVAFDMKDPTLECPPGFRTLTSPVRTCATPTSEYTPQCLSVTYPIHGVEYSRVCGKVIAYQYGRPDAFLNHPNTDINGAYLDGISLTHGKSPRNHIWSFAVAHDETRSDTTTCPCTRTDSNYTGAIPSFIRMDYFCDTGSRNASTRSTFYSEDPLWDGKGCGAQSSCCSFNNPPWFCKKLSEPTREDIELRVCSNVPAYSEDFPFEVVEIYVQ